MRGRHKEIGNYAILVLLTTLLFLSLIVGAPPSRHPVSHPFPGESDEAFPAGRRILKCRSQSGSPRGDGEET